MQFVKEICSYIKEFEKLKIISDIDGVLAEYKFGEGINIKNNVPGVYENKRPLYSIINLLNSISKIKGVELYLASSYFYDEQRIEKYRWVTKNLPFVNDSNLIFVKCKYGSKNDIEKLNAIHQQVIKESDVTLLIDDSHEFIFQAIEMFGNKIKAYHISSLIE